MSSVGRKQRLGTEQLGLSERPSPSGAFPPWARGPRRPGPTATVVPLLSIPLISSTLSTPAVSFPASYRRNPGNDNGRPNEMVGVPAFFPKTFRALFRKPAAFKPAIPKPSNTQPFRLALGTLEPDVRDLPLQAEPHRVLEELRRYPRPSARMGISRCHPSAEWHRSAALGSHACRSVTHLELPKIRKMGNNLVTKKARRTLWSVTPCIRCENIDMGQSGGTQHGGRACRSIALSASSAKCTRITAFRKRCQSANRWMEAGEEWL